MKPKIIAITSNVSAPGRLEPLGFGVRDQICAVMDTDYTDAIIAAGAVPLVVSVNASKDYIAAVCELADGLLLSGGPDVAPQRYGARVSEHCGPINSLRDEYEFAVLDAFWRRTNKPIFGICRGLQLLNVYLGGTLIQDLPSAGERAHTITCTDRWQGVHEVLTNGADAELAGIIGERSWVNSYHHQAIDRLAPGLEISARSDDGIIEAVVYKGARAANGAEITPERATGERYVAATQWHPEMMAAHNATAQEIISNFVAKC